ncbi:CPBP family intramembrane glutamic endopeptidase [Mucilaginibacter celer]|uniref:CPBP family intramembrane metalloprotease n=1 Tax=Mucilaginibacter celer TaxID=2305508 RepID=A0A494VY24_9SPHI|nr:CPBP family intramembrane glutamic endopeptidase [Mucilaginibacter celer]AYL98360.1 CPBP family intramembrane metalloprotease [Mucilaginibacter celer]
MIKEPYQQPQPQGSQITPFLQFIILSVGTVALVFVLSLIATGLIWVFFGEKTFTDALSFNTQNPNMGRALWLLQIVGTTLPLFLAPWLFAKFIMKDAHSYLKADVKFQPVLLIFILAIMVFSSPVMEVLVNVNEKLVLPDSMKALENLLRSMEEQAQKATEAMLQMKTVWDMLFGVLVVGLLTAIAEEFLFRGVLQTIMIRLTKNPHAGIWITAILFSAFHMEFFTFLPRVALGVFFGYFVMWSGSIWPGVWAHFLNNATQVVIMYLYQQKKISLNPDDQHVFNYQSYALSLIIILILLFMYRNIAKGKSLLLS